MSEIELAQFLLQQQIKLFHKIGRWSSEYNPTWDEVSPLARESFIWYAEQILKNKELIYGREPL